MIVRKQELLPESAVVIGFGDGDPEVDVLRRNSFPQDPWIGIYDTGILDGGSIDVSQGLLLNGAPFTFTFDLWLAEGSMLQEFPGIQVGYYNFDEGKDKVYFTQMSQNLVPEPATLLLLGSGLLAGGSFLRKKFKR